MNVQDFVMLGIHAAEGGIKGKTKLQKTMYFLGVLTDSLEQLGYRPYFYGPYSQEVADAVEWMKALRFVDQNVRGGGAISGSGFEMSRYDYRLNADGIQIAEKKMKAHPEHWEKIENAYKKLQEPGDRDYMKLSIAAKTHFFTVGRQSPVTQNELAKYASAFGWSVTGHEVKEAAEFLKKLGLVELAD